ncbi:MAG: helix-turn-helix transcriptional regulator [Rhodospirillales bacterium]|nr:helix-turn-helix transcriptional regulator [Rhodospirillales bacterium]
MSKDNRESLKLDTKAWHDQIATLIIAQGTPKFPEVLVETLKCVVPFDYSVFFAFHGQERPICLYDTFTPRQRIVMVSDYQEGPYLLDPFYLACHERAQSGLYRLRDIAPDRFYHSEYYRSYYRRTGLSEEISFIIALPDNIGLSISLMRGGGSPCFSERDINKLRRIESIVYANTALHWCNLGQDRDEVIETDNQLASFDLHIATAFENFGRAMLTPREREVVGMVLRGHSSESIGRHFGISTGTVKIHRKNIYAKLDISSQSELFSLFISHLSSKSPTIAFQPDDISQINH